MARKSESDNLNMISNEHQKLLKQKLKSLGIDEKAVTNGEQEPAEFISTEPEPNFLVDVLCCAVFPKVGVVPVTVSLQAASFPSI